MLTKSDLKQFNEVSNRGYLKGNNPKLLKEPKWIPRLFREKLTILNACQI